MSPLVGIKATEGFPPGIGMFLAQMEQVRRATVRGISHLSPEQLAWHPQPDTESIGTLLLHIAAVEHSWIQEDIMQREMGEEWKIAFPIRFGISQVTGQTAASFIETLDGVREETRAVLRELGDDDLERAVTPLEETGIEGATQYTVAWILHHLIDHEAHHKGQIAVMKRLLPR